MLFTDLNFDSIGHPITRFARHIKTKASKRVLIIGAGSSGEKILREIFDNPTIDYKVVGFLDDDLGKRGRALHGMPVFGPVDILPGIDDQM